MVLLEASLVTGKRLRAVCYRFNSVLFHTFLIIHGLDVRATPFHWLTKLTRLAFFGALTYQALELGDEAVELLSKDASFAKILTGPHGFMLFIVACHTALLVTRNECDLRDLLGSIKERSSISILLTCCSALSRPVIVLDRAIRSPANDGVLITVIRNWPMLCVRQAHITFQLIYVEILNCIIGELQRLHEDVRRAPRCAPVSTVEILIRRKWRIRNSIQRCNSLSGMSIFVLYMSTFAGWLTVLRGLAMADQIASERLILVLRGFLNVLTLLLAAYRGSAVIHVSHSTEVHILQYRQQTSHEEVKLREVFKFCPGCDSLTIGGLFQNQLSNLLHYLGMCITCAAITLQFDYQVIAKLNRLAAVNRGL